MAYWLGACVFRTVGFISANQSDISTGIRTTGSADPGANSPGSSFGTAVGSSSADTHFGGAPRSLFDPHDRGPVALSTISAYPSDSATDVSLVLAYRATRRF